MQVHRIRLAAALFVAAALLATAASSDEATVARGVVLLEAGRRDEAQQVLQAASLAASNDEERARAYFYLGLNEQQRAKGLADGSQERVAALQRSQKYYRMALATNPKSGGSLNNLAQVQADLGDRDAANATLERALALGDSRQALYKSTRAQVLAAGPPDARAQQATLEAALATPEDAAARERLVRIAAQGNPALIGELARKLLAQGYAGQAEEACVEGFASAPTERRALLVLLAQALAAQSYEPVAFSKFKARTVQALQQLGSDPAVARGASELLALHVKPVPDYRAYQWWTESYNKYGPPDRPGPYQTLRALAIRLGDWYRLAGSPESLRRAEPYVLIAVQLSGNTADPTAILNLAEVYAGTGQRDQLRKVSDEYVGALFQGKGGAYAMGNDEEIYRYHLALGTIYGYLGQWQNAQWSPASAIFQLEHAREAADRINRRTPDCGAKCVVVPPAAVELLATAYEQTGRPEEGVRVQAEAAQSYIKADRPAMAMKVINHVESTPLPPAVTDKTKVMLNTAKNQAIQYQPPKP